MRMPVHVCVMCMCEPPTPSSFHYYYWSIWGPIVNVSIIIVILMLFKCAALLSHRNIPFWLPLCYYSVLECVYLLCQNHLPCKRYTQSLSFSFLPASVRSLHFIRCGPFYASKLLFALQVIYRFAICLCARLQFDCMHNHCEFRITLIQNSQFYLHSNTQHTVYDCVLSIVLCAQNVYFS